MRMKQEKFNYANNNGRPHKQWFAWNALDASQAASCENKHGQLKLMNDACYLCVAAGYKYRQTPNPSHFIAPTFYLHLS